MIFLAIILYFILIFALLIEKAQNDRNLQSFRFVIHVNGIRGKTDVCRRIDALLRGNGLRVFTKTTGTHPCYLDTNRVEHQLRRRGPANIREQLKMIRLAAKEKADVLILECMAVRPELQNICQNKIIKNQYTVITNVRRDHLFELGETPEEIARSFCNTVPDQGTLFLGCDAGKVIFEQACAERNSVLSSCIPPDNLSPALQNQYIAEQVCSYLGFPPVETDLVADFGTAKLYSFQGNRKQKLQFLNLFSVNDPDSTLLQLQFFDLSQPVVYLYNHRPDRPDRFLLFQMYFFPKISSGQLWVTGKGGQLLIRLLKKKGVHASYHLWEDIFSLPEHTLIIGIGNIKGNGEKLVLDMERRGLYE